MSLNKPKEVSNMKKTKTFIVLIEDNADKSNNIISILDKEGIEYYLITALNPALRFITNESKKIDGIILDLGLPRFENERVEDITAGLDVVEELKRVGITIPVLINSSTLVEIDEKEYPFVFKERMFCSFDVETLRNFLNSLSNKEEQQKYCSSFVLHFY